MIHQFNPDMAPDSEFVPGRLEHLVPGNEGRLLDPRRTPIRIVALVPETGTFVCELLDFEDKGARWELPFEDASSFQFALASRAASPDQLREIEDAVRRYDHPLLVRADPVARERTLGRLESSRREAGSWLARHSSFFASRDGIDFTSRTGDPRLWADLEAWLRSRGLWEIEDEFATRFVSNPRSGECVKGHRIVLAELGLAAYEGTVIRDPGLFEGAWGRESRADHVLARMAFVQELFSRLPGDPPMLYRGIPTSGGLETRSPTTFVSASLSREVALSMIHPGGLPREGVLYQQPTPVSRLFMTYLETAHMNRQFKEAEAVLLGEADGGLF